MKDRIYLLFLIGTLFVVSLESHLTNYIAVYLEKNVESASLFGLFTVDGVNMIGILHAENTLLVVLAVGLVSWMVKKIPDNRRLVSGMTLYVCSYSLLSFTTAPAALVILMIFISIGELMYIPVRQSMLAEMAKDSYRSSYLALNSFMGQGTMIVAGATITLGGILPSYLISIGLFVLGITGVFLIRVVLKRIVRAIEADSKKSV
ncbi:hypothetical protein ACFO3D_12550 [Virgibacillus kekensis]|uniref:MFS transporter n=1 Tax=Virgibacillus kekensis TaxID=202261 RepID=A0ABV9DKS3_9BACI